MEATPAATGQAQETLDGFMARPTRATIWISYFLDSRNLEKKPVVDVRLSHGRIIEIE